MFVLIVAVAIAPSAYAGLQFDGAQVTEKSSGATQNVTVIASQGKEPVADSHGGELLVVETNTKNVLWRHDVYRRYFDVDSMGGSRLLLTAERFTTEGWVRFAEVTDWRTGETIQRFELPRDTHDVDYIGSGEYVVADKANNRIYVYHPTSNKTTWEFDFTDHYTREDGGPGDDWTHMNDVDVVDNGTAFLVSPRNYDRVMLIDRRTEQVRWTLGQEDNHSILYEQHNPDLLSISPPAVLVSDSENNRVVEYQCKATGWRSIWTYSDGLAWPRDADRLPNGNTLIVDSGNHRVVEVNPDAQVVWELETHPFPYDVERIVRGAPVSGAPSTTADKASCGASDVTTTGPSNQGQSPYTLAQWILPIWIGRLEFYLLLGAMTSATIWVAAETYWMVRG